MKTMRDECMEPLRREVPAFMPPKAKVKASEAPAKPIASYTNGRRLVEYSTEYTLPPGQTALPLKNDDHKVHLINLAYARHNPQSKFPAFRILGSFPDMDSAGDHKDKYFRDADVDMWTAFSHELMPICLTSERQVNAAHCARQVKQVVDLHTALYEKGQKQVDENIKLAKSDTNTDDSVHALECKHLANIREEVKRDMGSSSAPAGAKRASELSAAAGIHSQKFAVIIVLRDVRPEVLAKTFKSEPVIMILDVFPTEEQALFYIKYTARKAYPICAIDVVEMYTWIFPELVDSDQIKTFYGNDELDNIMQGRKQCNDEAQSYMDYCKQFNIPLPAQGEKK